MANSFSKEERVAFEDILASFNDALVLSSLVNKYNTNGQQMERSSDTIWRPEPYIAQSFDGSDATSNFKDSTQLAVPSTIGYQKHSTALLTAKELRDQLQENRLGQAAAQKLASDINVAVLTVASNQGTIVSKRTTAASGFTWPSISATTSWQMGKCHWCSWPSRSTASAVLAPSTVAPTLTRASWRLWPCARARPKR